MSLSEPLACCMADLSNDYAQLVQQSLNQAYMKAFNSTFAPFFGLKLYDPVEAQPEFD